VFHVTTLSNDGAGSLRWALESDEDYWIVFDVEGRIVLESGGVAERVQVRSNKTIDGRGRNIVIEGNLVLDDVTNVIISDVGLTNELEGHCTQEGDVLTIRGTGDSDPDTYSSRNIWIHHVELFLGGDGLLDIRGGSQITISWCHLHDHKKAMLAWLTQDDQPAPGMRVTYHHNYFERITLRGPQFVFGWAHFFNNYQHEWYEYGAASLGEAQFYSENNIYQARPGWFCVVPCPDPNPCGDNDTVVSKDALVTDWAENGTGYAVSVGDLALEDADISENQPQDVFIPSDYYGYTAEAATEELAARIAAESGPRVDYCR
jgi:pectate lyase